MKKLIVALLMIPMLASAADSTRICDGTNCAAIGLTAGLVPQTATRFSCGLAGLAASLTTCAAAVAGKSYYITDIVVGTTTATSGTYAIQTGTDANCATGTAVVFPAAPGTTSSRFQAPIAANPSTVISFTTPIVVPASGYICVIGVATNTININIHGYYN
jgi:hypothetical protein